MDPAVRRKLADFIREQGVALADDPQRVKALLLDSCPEARTEISLLITAAEDEIPMRLLRAVDPLLRGGEITRAILDLQQSRRLDREAAEWIVMSWAWALGIVDHEPNDAIRSEFSEQSMPPTVPGQPSQGRFTEPSNPVFAEPAASQEAGGFAPSWSTGQVPSWGPTGYPPPQPGAPEPTIPSQPVPDPPPPGAPQWAAPPVVPGRGGRRIGMTVAIVAGVVVMCLIVGTAIYAAAEAFGPFFPPHPSPTPTRPSPIAPATTPPSSPEPAVESVQFTLTSTLSDWEDREVAEVYIGGRNIAKLRISRIDQTDEQTLNLPEGVYEYDLSVQYWYTENGQSRSNTASGRGQLVVTDGVTFRVFFDNGVASLREVS